MIRLLATTALGLVLANAAFAQAPNTNTTSQQSAPSQDKSATPSTTTPSGTAQSQQTTSQPQQPSTSGPSAQNNQSTAPSSASPGSGTNAANNTDTSSRPQTGTANSSPTNPPASQQSANPPATNTNQAQDRSQPPANTNNQAQQAPSATGTNQAQQAPTNNQAQQAPSSNQAQGARTDTNSQMAARTDVKLDRQQETKISASISHLNVRPLTNVNFSLNVGTVVPRDVQLATLPPDVVEIVPQYRGYSFALVKDEIVIVDPATYKIVTVLPYSGQSTATTTTTTRERSASKFSDRDREVIRKHVKARPERSEVRTTGSTARTEIHVGDRVPDSVEVEEFPSTVYQDAPGLRDYRYIHRDTRTYVVEPRERRVIEEVE
ncbi:DUF1236 domain-containing protein [Bradyrhizobium sp. CCBAU 45384]|uniref:DUF1236 domain-containing protein n=1 Tax=Bradyrhizobium sp. CCBAU 45384 TaxID=858428 RepID=UPI0023060D41|nr:DUF1236 domain-containing protein [Bradyrhizobium sp. CCBAU 45384]MDA9410702.1 hypothetical protein [Bradyrhizobium sp. CCBAU 45384]